MAAEIGSVLLLLTIAAVWLLLCVLAVALCVAARGADDAIDAMTAATHDDVGFVATLAEPAQVVEAPTVSLPVRPRVS